MNYLSDLAFIGETKRIQHNSADHQIMMAEIMTVFTPQFLGLESYPQNTDKKTFQQHSLVVGVLYQKLRSMMKAMLFASPKMFDKWTNLDYTYLVQEVFKPALSTGGLLEDSKKLDERLLICVKIVLYFLKCNNFETRSEVTAGEIHLRPGVSIPLYELEILYVSKSVKRT